VVGIRSKNLPGISAVIIHDSVELSAGHKPIFLLPQKYSTFFFVFDIEDESARHGDLYFISKPK
jgi:hypothetical protein